MLYQSTLDFIKALKKLKQNCGILNVIQDAFEMYDFKLELCFFDQEWPLASTFIFSLT